MGDPRRLRNKYERPKKLWDVDRLKEEKGLKAEFGLKNMRELWHITAILKKYRREARRLLSQTEDERKDDAKKILTKLVGMGILKDTSTLDDILSLEVREFLERRLETVVLRQGLARTMPQSRQLIAHGYILVKGKRVTRPSYLIRLDDNIAYAKQIDISAKAPETKEADAKEEQKPAEGEQSASS